MKLIFAQGNPGTQYDNTRHNTGFFMLDRFASEQGGTWNEKSKYATLISELTINGEKVILAKPTTFYNETGRSARALVDFYKLDPAKDVLVIHDELALPFGTVRTRSSGSDAGNNGVKSLNAALGEDYRRIRIGIYNDQRDRVNDVDFVIGTFTKQETEKLPDISQLVNRQITSFLDNHQIDETVKL